MLKDVSGKESVVYKCVAESDPGGFDGWLNKAIDTFGVNAYNLVGGASSANQYSGPTIPDVAAKLNKRPQCAHGGVTIAERHVKKGNEHETLVRKGELGMRWFISQAIYDPEPMIKLLKEYGALCKQKKIAPKRIVLTFAPCGREKTMRFIKWLGVTVPEDVEKEISGGGRQGWQVRRPPVRHVPEDPGRDQGMRRAPRHLRRVRLHLQE